MERRCVKTPFFEEITPAAVICSWGETFYLGIMIHPLFVLPSAQMADFQCYSVGVVNASV